MPITTPAAPAALDLVEISVRIRRMTAAAELDGREFAERVGVPYSTMRAYVSGERPPSPEFLAGAYRAFGFMPSWVLTGDGPMEKGASARAITTGGPDPAYVVVPPYSLDEDEQPNVLRESRHSWGAASVCVPQSRLEQRGLAAEDLCVVMHHGSAMQGVLSHGDLVVVDRSDTAPRSGFVYALRQKDDVLLKYCEPLPGGLVRVSSANPSFAPYDVDVAKAQEDFRVIGRAVISSHDW